MFLVQGLSLGLIFMIVNMIEWNNQNQTVIKREIFQKDFMNHQLKRWFLIKYKSIISYTIVLMFDLNVNDL